MTDRTRMHAALDVLLDALDEYRSRPADPALVKVADLPFEAKAKAALIREGKLRTLKIGRELWTRPSDVAALADLLQMQAETEPVDELTAAARKRAARRAA